MKIFELHFNPRVKEDLIFDSFCFTPENFYERRLGELCMVGELKNALPKNSRLLQEIAQVIKEQYYKLSSKSPENSLAKTLKRTNDFLAEKVKKNDVSWLGNLNFALLSFKNFKLNFTKVGEINILLIRSGQITDIGKNLEFREIDPYPLKIFSSVVSGKLTKDDIILILTKEVFRFFSEQNLIQEIAKNSLPSSVKDESEDLLDERKLESILKPKDKELKKLSGICLVCILKPSLANEAKSITFQAKAEKFSVIQFILSLLKKFSQAITSFLFFLFKTLPGSILKNFSLKKPKPKLPKKSSLLKTLPHLSFSLPRFSLGELKNLPSQFVKKWEEKKKTEKFRKNGALILLLIFFLIIGFLFFRPDKAGKISAPKKEVLEDIKAKKEQGETFLIFKDEESANALFQEAWKELLPHIEGKQSLSKEVQILKESIEKNLLSLNKLQELKEPELLVAIDSKEAALAPQKLLGLESALYLFNSKNSNLYEFEIKEKKGNVLKADRELKEGVVFNKAMFFFSEPNILLSFNKESKSFKENMLELPSPAVNLTALFCFYSNIYFLDNLSGEIIKYSLLDIDPLIGKSWLNPESSKTPEVKSMTIDGNIWVLTKDNKIERYRGGLYQEILELNLFPYFENPTKIWTPTNSSYLYILEPSQNRIIILSKTGKVVKQFQSEKFNDLKDFAVSEDEKTIWLLNGFDVYQLKVETTENI